MANAILTAIGILATFLTIHTLLRKRALRGNGGDIVLGDTALQFTQAKGYKGVTASISYDDISKVTVTTGGENHVQLVAPASRPRKVTFDADNMVGLEDFTTLVDVIKRKADNASFAAKEIRE